MHHLEHNQSIPTSFSIMAKPIGPACNLSCAYCYYLEKESMFESTKSIKMSDGVLEKFISEYIKAQSVPAVQFVWHGGEPLIAGIDYYKKAIYLQRKYRRGKSIENVIQTNGTLLTDEWCRFLCDNNFLVGISIDGPEHLHDRYRLDNSGKPTFKQTMAGLELLIKHNIEFNTMTVLNDENVKYPLEIYRFLKSIGSRYMQFTPIVERLSDPAPNDTKHPRLLPPDNIAEHSIAPWSVDALNYGRFLCEVFDDWVVQDVGTYFVPIFDSVLANAVGHMPSMCVYAKTCGAAAAIEHSGDIFSCDHYVFPEYKIGNILYGSLASIISSQRQLTFGEAKFDKLPDYCRRCPYVSLCNGECPKNRISSTPDGDEGLNYLCQGLRLFFKHTAPYIEFMANEFKHDRAPSNVMAWARNKNTGS